MKSAPLALPLVLAAASCQAPVGTVPMSIIELYDMAAPDGGIELELERDGTVRELEADIPLDSVPEHILVAARDAAPGAVLTGAEREYTAAGPGWELKIDRDGRAWELVFDDDGSLVETEKELRASEAPAPVLEAAEGALPRSTFKSVEIITRGDHEEYHVKRMRDGATYKAVLTPAGEITRLVREARAEIEVPLR